MHRRRAWIGSLDKPRDSNVEPRDALVERDRCQFVVTNDAATVAHGATDTNHAVRLRRTLMSVCYRGKEEEEDGQKISSTAAPRFGPSRPFFLRSVG
eukprot:CAMPEP_0167829846 /NCGR_PEP_ID=MMETSP0112_2-20121227/12486_1 /TAXON_ID=91324 /ORGANISM="Lotharella globosa, Strain CCCM811" /LENGTH=96 /DNA_ID=CAMNT_0007733785 /DNA_START=156 /DNA_END=446 /DNA_ORIENTATION=-